MDIYILRSRHSVVSRPYDSHICSHASSIDGQLAYSFLYRQLRYIYVAAAATLPHTERKGEGRGGAGRGGAGETKCLSPPPKKNKGQPTNQPKTHFLLLSFKHPSHLPCHLSIQFSSSGCCCQVLKQIQPQARTQTQKNTSYDGISQIAHTRRLLTLTKGSPDWQSFHRVGASSRIAGK